MARKLAMLMIAGLTFTCLGRGAEMSWTGRISDNECGATKHNKACVERCVAGGAKYVLISKGKVYSLDPQDKFKGMGGDHVKVKGTLTDAAITVTSVKEQ